MKLRKPTTHLVEVGDPHSLLKLLSEPRHRFKMRMTCDHCGKKITDEYFIGAFIKGQPNPLLHEKCLPDDLQKVTANMVDGDSAHIKNAEWFIKKHDERKAK